MKRVISPLLFLLAGIVIGCGGQNGNNPDVKDVHEEKNLEKAKELPQVGESIAGDFDGNGKKEKALIHILKAGTFQEVPWKMSVDFSDANIPSIAFQSEAEEAFLMNEGNLDGLPGDELSLVTPPS